MEQNEDPVRTTRPRRAYRRRAWLALATTATLVAGLSVALVAVGDASNGAVRPATASATAADVPPYYVTLYYPPQPTPTPTSSASPSPASSASPSPTPPGPATSPGTDLLVGDTLTGKTLAILTPPAGASYYGVTGAANDRTFVVDTYDSLSVSDFSLPRTFYRLQIVPGTKTPVRLTRLPLPSMTGTFAMALSESGSELAVARLSPNYTKAWLQIFSVATGRLLRSWSTLNGYVFDRGADVMSDSNYGIAWVDGDRAVDFPYNYESKGALKTITVKGKKIRYRTIIDHVAVRTLHVSATGTNLIADSRVLWSVVPRETDGYPSGGCNEFQDALVSTNGKTVVCVSSYGPDTDRPAAKIVPWHLAWLATSTTDPKAVRTLYEDTIHSPIASGGWLAGLWTNASGTTAIGYWYFGSGNATPRVHFGVFSHGTFRALPTPPTVVVGGPVTISW